MKYCLKLLPLIALVGLVGCDNGTSRSTVDTPKTCIDTCAEEQKKGECNATSCTRVQPGNFCRPLNGVICEGLKEDVCGTSKGCNWKTPPTTAEDPSGQLVL